MTYPDKLVYLDVCAFGRLFDDLSQPRVKSEELAVRAILAGVMNGDIRLAHSHALEQEINRNPVQDHRDAILFFLEEFGERVDSENEVIRQEVALFRVSRISEFDAWHTAIAIHSSADFVTCDDRLLRKIGSLRTGIWVGTPTQFCEKEGIEWR